MRQRLHRPAALWGIAAAVVALVATGSALGPDPLARIEFGSVEAVAEELGISKRDVGDRLDLARAIERFGALGSVRCPSS